MKYPYQIILAILVFSFSFPTGLGAQVPQKMSYQAVIRDVSNAPITDHIIRLKISVLQGTNS
ncbi:MAG: hypothetical protein ABIQ02_06885, partial [Saprospiraceae bacterium]